MYNTRSEIVAAVKANDPNRPAAAVILTLGDKEYTVGWHSSANLGQDPTNVKYDIVVFLEGFTGLNMIQWMEETLCEGYERNAVCQLGTRTPYSLYKYYGVVYNGLTWSDDLQKAVVDLFQINTEWKGG